MKLETGYSLEKGDNLVDLKVLLGTFLSYVDFMYFSFFQQNLRHGWNRPNSFRFHSLLPLPPGYLGEIIRFL